MDPVRYSTIFVQAEGVSSISYFEYKANRLRPAITKYLYDQKEYWNETLQKYHAGDKVTNIVMQSAEDILNNIHNIDKELGFENKYQLFKLAYRKDKRLLVDMASDYFAFWACLDFFRRTHNLNAADPTYANIAVEFGRKKTEIYTKLESRLQMTKQVIK